MQKLFSVLRASDTSLISDIKRYESKTNEKINSYKGIGELYSSISEQHNLADNLTKEFDKKYNELKKEVEYFQDQLKWHEDFKSSYRTLLNEFKRRVEFEKRAEEKAKYFGEILSKKFDEEIKARNKFKEKALKYFPPPLQPLLFEFPIKYEIFPMQQKSSISNLYANDNAIFERICNDNSKSELLPVKIISKSKT